MSTNLENDNSDGEKNIRSAENFSLKQQKHT